MRFFYLGLLLTISCATTTTPAPISKPLVGDCGMVTSGDLKGKSGTIIDLNNEVYTLEYVTKGSLPFLIKLRVAKEYVTFCERK